MRVLDDLKLALVQTSLIWEDVAANRAHFDTLLEQTRGSDLVVLFEVFTTGFTMDSLRLSEPEDGPTVHWMRQWAQSLGAVVTGSLVIRTSDNTYRNRLFWARPDGTLLHYDKRHLFRMANEHLLYTPGDQQLLVECKGWKVRPLICYDLRFPVWSRDAHGTDLLIYVANWPEPRRGHWNKLLPARAIENLCYAVGVNRIGADPKGNKYSGDSQVADFHGNLLLDAGPADGVFQIVLSGQALSVYREQFPAFQDADRFEIL